MFNSVDPIPPSSLTLKGWMETTIPDSVSWLPQTIGWQILALIACYVLICAGFWRYKMYRFNTYRREALDAFSQLEKSQTSERGQAECSFQIIKAVAQYVDPTSAPLYRDDFLTFLNSSLTEKNHKSPEKSFQDDVGIKWVMGQVDPNIIFSSSDCEKIKRWCNEWIKAHYNPNQPKMSVWGVSALCHKLTHRKLTRSKGLSSAQLDEQSQTVQYEQKISPTSTAKVMESK